MTEPPSAPENVQITEVFKNSISLSWSPPTTDGGSPVIGYFIERSLAAKDRWLRITKSTMTQLNYADKEVVEDTEYIYRVTAENKVGAGPPSEPTKPVKAKDPWSKYKVGF